MNQGILLFLRFNGKGSVVLLRLALLLDTKQIGHLFQMLTDAFPVHIDFQEVVISAIRQGRAHGIEIGIVAQYQNRAGKAALFQFMNERKPIHAGHFQVRDNRINVLCLYNMQRFLPITGGCRQQESVLAPLHGGLESNLNLQAIKCTLCYLNEWLHLEYREYIVCRCRGHFQS